MENKSCWNLLLFLLLINLIIVGIRDKASLADLLNLSTSVNPIKRIKGASWLGAYIGILLAIIGDFNLLAILGAGIFLSSLGVIGFCDLRLGRMTSQWFTLLGIGIFFLAGASLLLWSIIILATG